MTYTATQLVTNAYYLSGIVARDLETVQGNQLNDGINLLNDLLAVKSIDTKLIPYFTQYNFNAVQGQELYFVPNLIDIETFVFYIGDVRYSMAPNPRRRYFGAGRIEGIQSLPFDWHFERQYGGGNLYVYFLPASNYPMTIWGKFALTSVTANQDMSLTYDRYYLVYLRYALAEYICNEFKVSFPEDSRRKLKELEAQLSLVSPNDMTLTKISTFSSSPSLNWGDVNTGRGWRPGY